MPNKHNLERMMEHENRYKRIRVEEKKSLKETSLCCVPAEETDHQSPPHASMMNALTAGRFHSRTTAEVFGEVCFRPDVMDLLERAVCVSKVP